MRCHPVRIFKHCLQLLLLAVLLLLLVVDVPLPEVHSRHDAVRQELERLQIPLSPTDIQMDSSLNNETNPLRIARLRKICETSADLKEKRGPINQNMLADVVFETLSCTPAKASSTDWKFLLIKLHQFRSPRPVWPQKIHKASTLKEANMTYLQEHKEPERTKILKTYYKYIIVRHPWLRLVAAYQERFEKMTTEGMKIDPIAKEIKAKYGHLHEAEHPLPFHHFVQYILGDSKNPWEIDRRWMPIRYACEPCFVGYDFIVKLDNLDFDMMALLFTVNVTAHKLPYFGSIVKQDPGVSTIMHYFQNVSESDYLRLVEFYKHDFEMYGYLVPPRPTEPPVKQEERVAVRGV